MATFFEYLEKNKKVYEFKIAVAGPDSSKMKDRIKMVLEKFTVVEMSNGKKTPIQESPLEFPQLTNVEVTHYEVSLRYPTTTQVLEEIISKSCDVKQTHVRVRTANDPLNSLGNEQHNTEKYTPLIGSDDLGGESAQHLVGNNRVMDLLKELEVAKKEREKIHNVGAKD